MRSKVANFIVSLVIFMLVGLTLHEYGHYLVAKLHGVTGYVQYPYLLGGVFWPDPLGQIITLDVYLAGGLFTFVVFALLYWFGLTGKRWDWDDLAGLGINALVQLCYGLAETSLYYSQATFNWLAPLAVAIGFLFGMVYYVPRLSAWWSEGEWA